MSSTGLDTNRPPRRGAASPPTRPFRHGREPSCRVIVVLSKRTMRLKNRTRSRAILARNSVSSPVEWSAEVRESPSTPAFRQISLSGIHAPRAKSHRHRPKCPGNIPHCWRKIHKIDKECRPELPRPTWVSRPFFSRFGSEPGTGGRRTGPVRVGSRRSGSGPPAAAGRQRGREPKQRLPTPFFAATPFLPDSFPRVAGQMSPAGPRLRRGRGSCARGRRPKTRMAVVSSSYLCRRNRQNEDLGDRILDRLVCDVLILPARRAPGDPIREGKLISGNGWCRPASPQAGGVSHRRHSGRWGMRGGCRHLDGRLGPSPHHFPDMSLRFHRGTRT